ncbi:hypothetical protein VPX56_17060 [Enterobacter wuhouensis]|uniref:Uncharacterized protein n=1 Tax=Enterobacter wuhouensis TaxID=2529381 RepID=A0ABZ1DG32_9ENTR|nr:hypothetical protein [Enterobacter wuhouensis]WRW30485.1 hypothetical protein VPX56_17060 [Enterobacter wuhouensis]
MAITLGSEFETDPMYSDFSFEPDQFPTKNQLEISLSLHEKSSIYIENVIGEDGKYAKNFLGRLEVEMFSNIHRINFIESMHKLLIDVYPQKYDFLGLDKTNALIERGTKKFKHDNTRPKIQAIYIILMFVIGHGFENDLFHQNENIFNSNAHDDDFYILKSKGFIVRFINALVL